jgi:hypothetical protein
MRVNFDDDDDDDDDDESSTGGKDSIANATIDAKAGMKRTRT